MAINRSSRVPMAVLRLYCALPAPKRGLPPVTHQNTFENPIDDRWFEDYRPDAVHEFGAITITESQIVEFAKQYDPQYFHTDPEEAKESMFGGLIASGWQTCGMMMRLYAEHYLTHNASLGSPGVDELRWHQPVRPGDQLSVRCTITEAKRSRSKPDRGIVHTFIEVLNQHRDVVLSMKAVNMLICREPG